MSNSSYSKEHKDNAISYFDSKFPPVYLTKRPDEELVNNEYKSNIILKRKSENEQLPENVQTVIYSKLRRGIFLRKIIELYKKYFGAQREFDIICTANILNLIMTVKISFEAQTEYLKYIKNVDEKFKLFKYAKILHNKYKKELQLNFLTYFFSTISDLNIHASDFKCLFQMIIVNIFTVFKKIFMSKFKSGGLFENVCQLICDNLSWNHNDCRIVITLLKSNSFHLECINMINLIEESKVTFPGIHNTLSLYFKSTNNIGSKYFANLHYAVTRGYNQNLTPIISTSYYQLNNGVDSSATIKNKSGLQTTALTINQNLNNEKKSNFIPKRKSKSEQPPKKLKTTNGKIVQNESIKNIIGDASTSTSYDSNSNNIGKIKVCDPGSMMGIKALEYFTSTFFSKNSNQIMIPNSKVTGSICLQEIIELYSKYFDVRRESNIICVANILNIITTAILSFETQTVHSFQIENMSERIKLFNSAKTLYDKFEKQLQLLFHSCFMEAISELNTHVPNFVRLFQMIIVSIFTIFKKIFMAKFKRGSIFENVCQLICAILSLDHNDYQTFVALLESNSFHLECINMINLIEESKDTFPGIHSTLLLFFISSNNIGLEHFAKLHISVLSAFNQNLTSIKSN